MVFLSFAGTAFGKTWYVRTDGGTAVQCTGLTNAPYTGGISTQWVNSHAYAVGSQISDTNGNLQQVTTAGTSSAQWAPSATGGWNTSLGGTTSDNTVVWTNKGTMPTKQNCAFNNPYWLVTDNTNYNAFSWIVGSGDTVQYTDQGPYYIGQQFGTLGITWLKCIGDVADCTLPPLPSGVTYRGSNAGSCHTAGHTVLSNPTQFVGINSVYWMFSLQGSVGSDFECFEFTQPDMCTLSGLGNVPTSINCSQGVNNYAIHGLILNTFIGDDTFSPGPANSTIRDFSAHGLANEGISGSKLNSQSTDVMTFSDIYLAGNANTGWDSDAGGCNNGCESVGTINVSHLISVWSGCMEVKPNGGTIGGNGYTNCVDQAYNGNGDNVVMIATAGTWNWSDITTKWGAQDGFDGLHMGDDPSAKVIVNITRAWSEGNEGQQIKVGGSVNVTNSVSISNCRRLGMPFPGNPSGYNTYVGLLCRANDGNAFQLSPGRTMTLENNTFIGYGNPILDMSCNQGSTDPVSGAQFYCPAGSLSVILRNNTFLGYTDPVTGTQPGGLYWGTATDPFANTSPTWKGVALIPSAIDHNLWGPQILKSSGGAACPQDVAYETHAVCGDPLFVGESNFNITTLDGLNVNLTAASPAIGAGVGISGLTTDLYGLLRPSPPSIGAVEFGSGSTGTAPIPLVAVVLLSATPNPAVAGQPITLTASVTAIGATPTGTITFYDGTTSLGSASLNGSAIASLTTSSLAAGLHALTASYSGDSVYALGVSIGNALTITAATAPQSVSISVAQPQFGFNVIPGSTRRIFADVTNGSTNGVTWTVTSGSASLSSNSGSWIDVTAPATGASCSYALVSGAWTVTSSAQFVVTATSMDDATKSRAVTFNVCNPTVQVDVVPFYRTLYASQAADVQSIVKGAVDQNVHWAITSQPTGGNGTITDTTSRDVVFSATVPGRYVLTATSQLNSSASATAVMYVTGHTMPYKVTPNKTEPVDCTVDPAMLGTTYEVGPSQAFKTLASVPFSSMIAGSTVRLHNEDTTGLSPTTYHEYVQISQAGTATQPIRICGVPDSLGNLPVMDASSATGRSDASATSGGYGLITVQGSSTSGVYPNFSGPAYIAVEGIKLQNAQAGSSYTAPNGSAGSWSANSSAIRVTQAHHFAAVGNDITANGTGVYSDFTPATTWGGSTVDLLWEGNHLHGNGAAGVSTSHQMYLQAWNEIAQFNRIENFVSGGTGANVKSRSLGTVIRYNYLGDGAARQMDLVEAQDSATYMTFSGYLSGYPSSFHDLHPTDAYTADLMAAAQEQWNSHYIYGNIYQNLTSYQPIRFGYGTVGGEAARKGNLFWYNNTFYEETCSGCSGKTLTLFDTQGDGGVTLPLAEYPTVQVFNNVLWMASPSQPVFQWNDYSTFIAVAGENQIAANWGTNNTAGGSGSGWSASTDSNAYQNASALGSHLTGFTTTNLETASSMPFDPTTWILNSDVAGSQGVPSAVCEMPVRFAYLPSLGYAVPRIGAPNTGATDTVAEIASTMTSVGGSARYNTRNSNCR